MKDLYKEMDMESIYRNYEEESYQRLQSLIHSRAGDLPHDIFVDFAAKIYKRNK